MQQAIYLEGGPLMWMLPLYLHINQKSDYDETIYDVNVKKQKRHFKDTAQSGARRKRQLYVTDSKRQNSLQ